MSYDKEREAIRKELECIVHPLGYLKTYKYVVVCTFYQGKYVLSRHKIRETWETQGGHIEVNESPIEAAKRELFEESGITDTDIYPVCDYYGYNHERHSNGQVFVAIVKSLNTLPDFEMKEIKLFDELPANLTYPKVTPILFEQSKKYMSSVIAKVEESAMAVVICNGKILSTTEMVYGQERISLPKGHIEEGETALEAAIKECYEETNIVINTNNFIKELTPFTYEFLTPTNQLIRKTLSSYLFEVKDFGNPLPKEKRMISVNWMSVEGFLSVCSYDNVKNVVKEFQSAIIK